MASIQRRRTSKIWTAFYRDADGRLHSRSTATTDRTLARRIAAEYEAAARKKRTLRQLQRVLDQMHELVSGEHVARTTLREHVAQWLETKRPETAPATLGFYACSSEKLLEHLGPKADAPIAEVTKADLLSYRASLAACLSSVTTNHHLGVVKAVFTAAIRDGLLADNPAEFIDGLKAERSTALARRAFSVEELRAILDIADPEWRSLILCGLYTGQRLGDLVGLTWQNVDLEKGQLRLATRKTGKVLILPLAPPLQRHFESLPAGDEVAAPIHPRAYATLQVQGQVSTLSGQFRELLAQSGLAPARTRTGTGVGRGGRRQRSELSFHSLRHSATSFLHEAGVPASVAQDFVGHSSRQVHQKYVGIGWEALTKAANALPEL